MEPGDRPQLDVSASRRTAAGQAAAAFREEQRWPPALAILAVITLLALLPHHVLAMPVWVSYLALLVVFVSMAVVTFGGTTKSSTWASVERAVIVLFAAVYVANTAAELADMIGIITLHPPETRKVSLLSSSLAIWVTNVLAFSLLYWQVDRGGAHARARGAQARPDWLFPQTSLPEEASPGWRPMFLDYFYLAFNTATAFSPTDVLPLTQRAKMLMMLESSIALLTLVIVAARAVNVIP